MTRLREGDRRRVPVGATFMVSGVECEGCVVSGRAFGGMKKKKDRLNGVKVVLKKNLCAGTVGYLHSCRFEITVRACRIFDDNRSRVHQFRQCYAD